MPVPVAFELEVPALLEAGVPEVLEPAPRVVVVPEAPVPQLPEPEVPVLPLVPELEVPEAPLPEVPIVPEFEVPVMLLPLELPSIEPLEVAPEDEPPIELPELPVELQAARLMAIIAPIRTPWNFFMIISLCLVDDAMMGLCQTVQNRKSPSSCVGPC
jgi:hypothetical protein